MGSFVVCLCTRRRMGWLLCVCEMFTPFLHFLSPFCLGSFLFSFTCEPVTVSFSEFFQRSEKSEAFLTFRLKDWQASGPTSRLSFSSLTEFFFRLSLPFKFHPISCSSNGKDKNSDRKKEERIYEQFWTVRSTNIARKRTKTREQCYGTEHLKRRDNSFVRSNSWTVDVSDVRTSPGMKRIRSKKDIGQSSVKSTWDDEQRKRQTVRWNEGNTRTRTRARTRILEYSAHMGQKMKFARRQTDGKNRTESLRWRKQQHRWGMRIEDNRKTGSENRRSEMMARKRSTQQ